MYVSTPLLLWVKNTSGAWGQRPRALRKERPL